MTDGPAVMRQVSLLVDAWCERRALRALREMLGGLPVEEGPADEWPDVRAALLAVREHASHELQGDERETLDRLIAEVDAIVRRN